MEGNEFCRKENVTFYFSFLCNFNHDHFYWHIGFNFTSGLLTDTCNALTRF